MTTVTPHLVSYTSGTQTSDSTSWSASYPGDIRAGDLILFCTSADGTASPSSFSSHTFISSSFNNGSAVTGSFNKRTADGTETGSFTVTMSAAEQGCWRCIRIANWGLWLGVNWANSDPSGGSVSLSGVTSGIDDSVEPSAMTPFNWSLLTFQTLIVIGICTDGTVTTTTNPTSISNPQVGAPYIDFGGPAQSSGGANGVGLHLCARAAVGMATEFMSAATLSGAEDWVSSTFAIQPFDVGEIYFKPRSLVRVGG